MSEFLRTSLKYSAEILTGIAIGPALALGVAGNIIENHSQFKIFRGAGWLVGRSCSILIAVSAIPLIIVGIAKATFFGLLHEATPCSLTTRDISKLTYAQLQQSSTFVFSLVAILLNFDVIRLFFDFRTFLITAEDDNLYAILYAVEKSMDNLDCDVVFKKALLDRLEMAFIKYERKKDSIPSVFLEDDDLNTPPSVESPHSKPGKIEKPKTPSPKNKPPTPPSAPGVIVIPEDAKDSPNSSPSPLPKKLKNEEKKVKSLNSSPNPSDSKPSPEKGEEGYDLMPDFVKNLFKRPKSA